MLYSYKATILTQSHNWIKVKGLIFVQDFIKGDIPKATPEERIKSYVEKTHAASDDELIKFSCKIVPTI